jgi:hypothetical protein
MNTAATKRKQSIRSRILSVAYDEFYERGFLHGSINQNIKEPIRRRGILPSFRRQKGFGYAVLEEVLHPQLRER